ncbi:hypothetical protein GCM10022408_26630 [Hymenobacter fastidiosus]|uniref:Class I SAM-dependent methyltransferase n=1 Tax=Hymenobacter fastidiosus TaxID=486264 RepID=A0ABP7SJL6_9BACT
MVYSIRREKCGQQPGLDGIGLFFRKARWQVCHHYLEAILPRFHFDMGEISPDLIVVHEGLFHVKNPALLRKTRQ